MSAEGQDEPLLTVDVQAGTATGAADCGGGYGGLSCKLGFACLTFNSAMAIYRSNRHMGEVAIVVFSYGVLLLLLCCLRRYERAEQRSATRWKGKMVIWELTTTVTLAFSYKAAAIMPLPVQVLVWAMALGTVLCGGFYAFVLYRRKTKKVLLGVLGGIASPAIRLIVDSGASMHAVGQPSLLRGVRLYTVPRLVTQPDGTGLNILGIGHIQLDEQFRIPNVSLVQGLQECLISVGQLDTDHGITTCLGRGIARMMLADGTIVGGAIRDNVDNMYVLRFLNVPESTHI